LSAGQGQPVSPKARLRNKVTPERNYRDLLRKRAYKIDNALDTLPP
jgi:hypothetical protein